MQRTICPAPTTSSSQSKNGGSNELAHKVFHRNAVLRASVHRNSLHQQAFRYRTGIWNALLVPGNDVWRRDVPRIHGARIGFGPHRSTPHDLRIRRDLWACGKHSRIPGTHRCAESRSRTRNREHQLRDRVRCGSRPRSSTPRSLHRSSLQRTSHYRPTADHRRHRSHLELEVRAHKMYPPPLRKTLGWGFWLLTKYI